MVNNSKILSKLTSPLALLLLAAGLAGGVSMMAYYYLQQREISIKTELAAKGRSQQRPMVGVVVPAIDVGINTVLNKANFVERKVEADLVYPDTVLSKDFPNLEGQKLARAVMHGRPVRVSDLQLPEINDVSSILPSGSRAVTIEIDNLNSFAHTLRPNHHVDLFLLSKAAKARNPGADGGEQSLEQATLFMQDMVVLATGKEFQDVSGDAGEAAKRVRPGEVEGAKERGFDTITLLVNPAQAARVLIGQRMGSYRVVLRGNKDRDAVRLAPLRAADLLAGPVEKTPHDAHIEFIVGGRGDKIVSHMIVSPSQQLINATLAGATSALGTPPPPGPNGNGLLNLSSAANQPIPALRGKLQAN